MATQEVEEEPVFDPWYEYLSTLELVLLCGTGAAAAGTLWAGLTTPETDLRVAVGLALLFVGFMAFLARWSVSEERTGAAPTFDRGEDGPG
jgi:hypothetical protein